MGQPPAVHHPGPTLDLTGPLGPPVPGHVDGFYEPGRAEAALGDAAQVAQLLETPPWNATMQEMPLGRNPPRHDTPRLEGTGLELDGFFMHFISIPKIAPPKSWWKDGGNMVEFHFF